VPALNASASAGPNVFIVDDTFWTGLDRSWALADALSAGTTRKNWLLAQARLDTVVEHPELLEKWRPLARNFDVFFGFEAPTTEGLDALNKDVDVARTGEALAVARKLGFGVTGNFIIDPAYTEDDFQALWSFLQQHQLSRVGFTILTPLPGTRYFEQMRDRLALLEWGQFDLHHLLWQPHLPVRRFFELYCETWRRSVLYLQGQKPWWKWIPNVRLRDVPRLARILRRTQRLMDPEVYLSQCVLNDSMPAGAADGATSPRSLESAESSRAE
jgi:hopanoid C-3 methylase